MYPILLFAFINYMVSNNFVVGLFSGVYIGVKYHKTLTPYTNYLEKEAKKKIHELKVVYDNIDKKNSKK